MSYNYLNTSQEINEDHRLLNVWGRFGPSADNTLGKNWYRFTNGFEKMPETCPIALSCGAKKPGAHYTVIYSIKVPEHSVCRRAIAD